ncbi:hypothetical protein TWF730_004727 [Orbilia blumenaviensis]|uniref:Uncharacterized protein n=1 Tax=Orbilia blumenaviensis TaxID=1796055 RepID=A0AAV9TWU6_9PEZI
MSLCTNRYELGLGPSVNHVNGSRGVILLCNELVTVETVVVQFAFEFEASKKVASQDFQIRKHHRARRSKPESRDPEIRAQTLFPSP